MVAVHLHRRDVLVEQGPPLGLGGCFPDLVEVDVGQELSDSLELFGEVVGRRACFHFGFRKRLELCGDALLLLGEEVRRKLVGVVQLELLPSLRFESRLLLPSSRLAAARVPAAPGPSRQFGSDCGLQFGILTDETQGE